MTCLVSRQKSTWTCARPLRPSRGGTIDDAITTWLPNMPVLHLTEGTPLFESLPMHRWLVAAVLALTVAVTGCSSWPGPPSMIPEPPPPTAPPPPPPHHRLHHRRPHHRHCHQFTATATTGRSGFGKDYLRCGRLLRCRPDELAPAVCRDAGRNHQESLGNQPRNRDRSRPHRLARGRPRRAGTFRKACNRREGVHGGPRPGGPSRLYRRQGGG